MKVSISIIDLKELATLETLPNNCFLILSVFKLNDQALIVYIEAGIPKILSRYNFNKIKGIQVLLKK